jgi:hypothetical protein
MRLDVALNQESGWPSEAIVNFTASGSNTIVLGVGNQIIRVFKYFVVVRLATDLTYLDGANLLTGPVPLANNEAMVFTFDSKPWYTCSPGNSFNISSSVGTQVSGRCYYTQTQA